MRVVKRIVDNSMNEIVYSKEHPEFLTLTCLEWKHISLPLLVFFTNKRDELG